MTPLTRTPQQAHSQVHSTTTNTRDQHQPPGTKIKKESHLRITICRGRAGWRPQLNPMPVVLILVGGSGC